MAIKRASEARRLTGETRETAAKLLQHVLLSNRLAAKAEHIWDEWPSLRLVAAKLSWFVSPLVITGDQNVLSEALRSAIQAFHDYDGDPRGKACAFLHAVQETARSLAKLRMSARDETGGWLVWTGDEPLMGWLGALGVSSIQIIERQRSVGDAQMAVRLMSYVCTMRELRLAGLAISIVRDDDNA